MGKFGDQVNQYAKTTSGRMEHEFDVNIEHTVQHGNAHDPVRGADGHSPNDRRESEPVMPAQPGRSAQVDLRGAARDARAKRGQGR